MRSLKLFLSLFMLLYTFIVLFGGMMVIDIYLGGVSTGWQVFAGLAIGIGWIIPIGLMLHLKKAYDNKTNKQNDNHTKADTKTP